MGLLILSIVVDHTDPQTVYAGSVTSGLYKSLDGGMNWTNIGLRHVTIFHLTMDPVDPSVLFAGTSRGPYISRDGGETWALAGQDTPFIFSMISDPNDRQRVYIGAVDGTFYKSNDGGQAWSIPERLLPPLDTNAIGIDATDDILYVALSGFDEGIHTSAFYRSRDDGETWYPGDNSLFADERLIAMTVDPSNGDIFLASYSPAGCLYKSQDHGDTWTELPVGVGEDFMACIVVQPIAAEMSAIYVSILNDQSPGADPGIPVRRSLDGGMTWQVASTGISEFDTTCMLYAGDGKLYAIGGENSVYTSTDLGSNWSQVGAVGNNVHVFSIIANTPNELYAGTDDGVYRSENGGVLWARVGDLLDEPVQPIPHKIALSENGIYSGTSNRGVFFSEDQGATWSGGITQEHSLMVPHAMAVDPLDTNRIYVATGNQGVAVSNDGGITWAFTNSGLGAKVMFTITIDPTNPNRLYASSQDRGVWMSEDRGETWAELNTGLFNDFVTALTIDVNNPNIIYAGTEGGGVFRLERE